MRAPIPSDITFTPAEERLPETHGSQAFVYIKRANGKVTKGMFYVNGKQPVFASYGSEVTDAVAWAYWVSESHKALGQKEGNL